VSPNRWRLPQGAVRTVDVVVVNVLGQHRPQMPAFDDEHPVQHLTPNGGHPTLRVGIRPRRGSPSPWPAGPAGAGRSSGAGPGLDASAAAWPGWTNSPRQIARANSRASPACTARSAQSTCGRATWRRSTATTWRSISSSMSFAAELRDSSASHPTTWQNIGQSSRRSCTDHRGSVILGRTRSSAPTTDFLAPIASGFHRKPLQLGDVALGSLPGQRAQDPGEEATSCDMPGFVHCSR
jgi:hypothetical protein